MTATTGPRKGRVTMAELAESKGCEIEEDSGWFSLKFKWSRFTFLDLYFGQNKGRDREPTRIQAWAMIRVCLLALPDAAPVKRGGGR